MQGEFRLFPRAASTVAERIDAIYLFEVAVASFFTLLICALVISMGVRYRRGSPAARENPPESRWLEVSWAVVPFVLSMVMFAWGAIVFFETRTMPEDAMRVEVVAKQWMWKLQHANGRREVNELHVPIGRAVRLRMTSDDVIHSFYVPAFRTKQDVLPGRYTETWFEATQTGSFHLFCAEYCGTEHSQMIGRVVVMEQREFAEWLSRTSASEPPAVAGERLFEELRCAGCHSPGSGRRGPGLVGVFGRPVPLEGGGTVLADANYVRESILRPQAKRVAGFPAIMPAYPQLTADEVNQLVAYVESLSATTVDQPGADDAATENDPRERDPQPQRVPGGAAEQGGNR
jgi:cytochrome c oxidase subunit II